MNLKLWKESLLILKEVMHKKSKAFLMLGRVEEAHLRRHSEQ